MRTYDNQPSDLLNKIALSNLIMSELKDNLPNCKINEWFLDSCDFANMVDKIAEIILEEE